MSKNAWKQADRHHALDELSALLEISCVSNCQLLNTEALAELESSKLLKK